jgi:hypothetical protein
MTETVLVTDGSGFVATHLVSQLLDRGYPVRASVRSLASAAKVEPLRTGTDVITPAVEGTRNIIAGIGRAPSVQRLVLTSDGDGQPALPSSTCATRRRRTSRRRRTRPPPAGTSWPGPRWSPSKHLGISFAVDNHRSADELGLVYRPVRETMLDHYESWRARRARPR